MADRTTVMSWLEGLAQDDWRQFHSDSEVQEIAKAAFALLKEQEAVEPIPPTDESEMWRCGNCHHQIFRCRHQRFCERCGREVKWE